MSDERISECAKELLESEDVNWLKSQIQKYGFDWVCDYFIDLFETEKVLMGWDVWEMRNDVFSLIYIQVA